MNLNQGQIWCVEWISKLCMGTGSTEEGTVVATSRRHCEQDNDRLLDEQLENCGL